MLEQVIQEIDVRLRPGDEARKKVLQLFERGGVGSAQIIGRSEEHREIPGFVVGRGACRVSLIAGNHSDEPVGPETLLLLLTAFAVETSRYSSLLDTFTFVVVPHTNPDGEQRNRTWIDCWPDAEAYLRHGFRELPGRDMEFAFPAGRQENRDVAAFLKSYGPYHLHVSLHGMGFSDGAFLLIERRWGFRTKSLQEHFRTLARDAQLELHDHNRQGEKGFFYLGPGFNTTPEGEAMRAFFRANGDDATAGKFGMSSMEYVRSLGGDPLCLVTELPLFLITGDQRSEPGRPGPYLAFLDRVRGVRTSSDAMVLESFLDDFGVVPLELRTAIRLQLGVIEAALETVR